LKRNSTGLSKNKGFRKRDQNIGVYNQFHKDNIGVKDIGC
jgi:hypothetical protein